jgi:hypothetical protein
MDELQLPGVESLALEQGPVRFVRRHTEVARGQYPAAVSHIAGDGAANGAQMDAQLMGPSGAGV